MTFGWPSPKSRANTHQEWQPAQEGSVQGEAQRPVMRRACRRQRLAQGDGGGADGGDEGAFCGRAAPEARQAPVWGGEVRSCARRSLPI